jgi:methylmalonyl-CoA carboxyltransferase small subunit
LKLQITINGKAYEADVQVLEDDEVVPHAALPTFQPVPVTYAPVAVGAGSHAPDASIFGGEQKVLRSPVTGLVVRVEAQAGQPVQKGNLLVVLESMKMETNITALGAATIKSITVEQGQSVKTGEILVVFE